MSNLTTQRDAWEIYQEFIASGWRSKGNYPQNMQGAADDPSVVAVAALGLAGEAGEAAEHIKKLLRGDPGYVLNKSAFGLELGDVLAYVAANCAIHGLSIYDVMMGNVEKLEERRKQFSQESSP